MSISALRRVLARGAEHASWLGAARRDALFVAAGVPLGAPAFLIFLSPKKTLFLQALLIVACLDLLTTAQRSRLRAVRGVEVPGRLPPGAGWVPRLRAGFTWRQATYHLVLAPLLALSGAVLLAGLGAGLVMVTIYAWVPLMPVGSALRTGRSWATDDVLVTVGGLVLLVAVPLLIRRLAQLDELLARVLLGPNRAELLARRVEDLAESRAGVVDAADAERRRIERDLHDGAQQRLVSLAMNLGLARRTLKDVPPEVMQVIVEAHEEAQAAIAELRDLVRGLHPVVLEDRGLDAALSGIAARSPVPVRLTADLPDRMAPTIEAVAYFTVSEALANVAKHARASRVDLSLRQKGGRLRIVLTDDGVGGADPTRGTGLTGLRKRAASVDGTLAISSPLGGPTIITVELPCEL
ncbi:Putative two-component system sensor kinase [Kitasatospora sp. MMS16-BH015]|uniref:sensor histidine kinase n=1 Tax=Kitasatospora sp. MMS16-BH015 TaxID=2018025 RepID=UPI000CA19424|nr:sensor histidine kinase [Kitasatospora sp. MMS16-BH015]AUG77133.1 Putative two-component system sensor kinase [Kitasatospora sp. MMS16-BH015]